VICLDTTYYQLKPPVSALNAIAYTVCIKQFVVSLPAISLGDWFSVVGKGEVGWYIHPKGENSMAVCGFGLKSVTRVIAQMVVENGHLASLGLHAVFKCDLLARY